jgi:hypothetical protein
MSLVPDPWRREELERVPRQIALVLRMSLALGADDADSANAVIDEIRADDDAACLKRRITCRVAVGASNQIEMHP